MLKDYLMKKLKKSVTVLASEAVKYVEENYNSEKGAIKKQIAINYVVDKLQLIGFLKIFKPFIIGILGEFIDDTIEFFVRKIRLLQT